MDEMSAAKVQVATTAGVIESDETVESLIQNTRLLSDNAIPVPLALGDIFKDRFEDVTKLYEDYHKDWLAAIKEYHLTGSVKSSEDNQAPAQNFVRVIVQSLLDLTYMQNPTAEFSTISDDQKDREFSEMLSAVITSVVNKRSAGGLNIRPYILLQMALAHLTNFGVLKLTYTKREVSQERVLDLFNKTKTKLQETKDPDEAAPFYELLNTLYGKLNQTTPFGLAVKSVWPLHFFSDPDGKLLDLSDSKWTMEIDFIETAFLKSEYMFLDEEEKWRFKYDKAKLFDMKKTGADSADDIKLKLVEALMPEEQEDKTRIRLKDKTPCLWIQDRTTRLTYLYILDRWDTPVWVFEDELELSRFFHYFILSFSAGTGSIVKNSESSYYIPFQNEINDIEKTKTFARKTAFKTFVFNSDAIDEEELNKVFKAILNRKNEFKGIGLKLKDRELDLEKIIKPFLVPQGQIAEMFDTTSMVQAIDKTSRLAEAFRGQEFKTNTTNDAIAQYQNVAGTRLNTLVDAVEEVAAQLFWAIAEVIVSKYQQEDIVDLVGPSMAKAFRPMPVKEFNKLITMSVEAGSSEKENSTGKKKEAIQIIQMLGQFGKAAPQSVLSVIFRMLRSVFSRKLVSDGDIDALKQETAANMQSQTTQPPANGVQ